MHGDFGFLGMLPRNHTTRLYEAAQARFVRCFFVRHRHKNFKTTIFQKGKMRTTTNPKPLLGMVARCSLQGLQNENTIETKGKRL